LNQKVKNTSELIKELQEIKQKNADLDRVVHHYADTKKLQKALFEIVDLANSSQSLDVFYKTLHSIISSLIPAKNFFIILHHPNTKHVSFPYYVDEDDDEQSEDDPLHNPNAMIPVAKIEGSPTMKVIQTGKLLHLNRQETLKTSMLGKIPEDWIGVPLILEEQLLGAVVIQSYEKGFRYHKKFENLLKYVSQHIAASLRRRQDAESLKEAHQKLQEYNNELEERVAGRTEELKSINKALANEVKVRRKGEKIQKALFNIADLVNTADSIDDLFVGVHKSISELMYAENTFLATIAEDEVTLEFPYFVDKHDDRPGLIKLDPNTPEHKRTTTARILNSGNSILLNQSESSEITQTGPYAISWLGVPLKDKSKTFGVLVVQSYDPKHIYTTQEQLVLETIAHQVSSAILRKKDSDALLQAHESLERRVKERTSVLERTIIKRRKIEKRLEYESLHDSLTELPNRKFLLEELTEVLKNKTTSQECDLALLFLDLDRFKIINDSLGHYVGDLFLVEVSKRLTRCMREHDVVVRLGGDEFCVLMHDVDSIQIAVRLAERVLRTLREPVEVEQHSLITSASIGVRIVKTGEDTADKVIGDADAAMYQAKHGGKDRYCLFDANIKETVSKRLKIEQDLRQAIGTQQISLFYQPIVDLFDNRVIGLEALIRWQHSELGFISPAEFIPIAEETGLIQELGESVVEMACQALNEFSKVQELKHLYVNINISAMQILSRTLDDFIRKQINTYDVDTSKLNAEITESILVEDFNAAIQFVQELKSIGMKVLLDDFGTGYSSLSYLHQFPFDIIKLDQSFIQSTEENDKMVGLIESIVFLVASLGMKIVVEGVETKPQNAIAQNLNCHFGQGYLYAKPMPKEALLEFILNS
jgi:diguanylate cyclase (GGDEF)-like protein